MQHRLDNWHTTMFILGVISMLMVPLAFGLREQHAALAKPGAAIPEGTGTRCGRRFRRKASGCSLSASSCADFTDMSFFGTSISALELGGWAIGLVGLFNIAGS